MTFIFFNLPLMKLSYENRIWIILSSSQIFIPCCSNRPIQKKEKRKKEKKKKKKKKKPILWNLHAIFYIFFSHVCKNSFWYPSLNYIIMEHLNVEFLHLNYIVNCIIHHCRSREISSKSNFKHEKRKVYRRASWVYSRLERVFTSICTNIYVYFNIKLFFFIFYITTFQKHLHQIIYFIL